MSNTGSKLSGKTNLSSFINGLWKHLLIVIICISVLFPIYFMVITSVKTQGQYLNNIWAISFPFNFLNFGEAFKGRFLLWFKNSAILTFGSTVLATFFASLMAYAFARLKFRGKNGILSSIISLMVIPPAVIILPIVVLWSKIGLINTYAGAIIVYTGLILPFSVYLLTNFFRTIPTEIIEAAVIDGCSTFQVFRLIVLGLSKPAIFTNIIVNAVWIWNELFVAMILLPNEKMKTLMVGLAVFKTHYNVNVPVIMAGLIIATLPMAVLYLMGQNFLIKGLIVGYGK